MSLVTRFEKNSLRKFYRTVIPLQVVLDGKSYNAIDWSLTGLALDIPDMKSRPGDKIDAQLILPIHDARLSLPVTLFHEYNQDDRNGFSFVDLSEKHKNVLRRFIEMAIEGKIDRVDDIVAVYEEPEIVTPIQTPVTLQEEEAHALKRSFVRTSARYLLFAVLVAGLLGLVLFYNLRYIYEGSGVVTGNDLMVYPAVSALVEKVYVHESDSVTPGMPLVQLDSSGGICSTFPICSVFCLKAGTAIFWSSAVRFLTAGSAIYCVTTVERSSLDRQRQGGISGMRFLNSV